MKTLFLVIGLSITFFLNSQTQQVQLTSLFCNSTLAALGSNFYWTTNGSEQYRIKITQGINIWTYAPGFTSTGYPKTFTNLIFAGVNPQYNTTYTIQVDYMISGSWQNNWGPSCTVTTPPFTGIQLETTFCNATLSSLTSVFRAQTISGGTTWRFRVTNTVTGEVKVVDKDASFGSTTTRRTTSISQLASLPGTGSFTAIGQAIYTIECAVSIQGGPFSDYGSPCNITITQSLNPTIEASDCGVEHNYIFQDFLDAVPPTPSTGCTYQFRLIDQSTSIAIESAIINTPKIKIYDIPGYAYNKTYSASVRCIRQGIIGSYGPECTLYTEDTPYTKIQDGQFNTINNCDVTRTFTQRIYAFAIPGGKYEFEIDNGFAVYYHQTNNVRNFRLSEIPGYVQVFNTNHNIRVRVSMDNYATFGPWGESCYITTPSAILPNPIISPNPSSNTFKIENVESTKPILITDLSGKVIETYIDSTQEIGGNLPTGVYYIVIEDKIYKIFKN